jgi:putative oxidoreductase
MASLNATLGRSAPHVLSLLRIIVALLFLQHGLEKFFGFPAAGPRHLSPLLVAAASLETVGGLLLLIGLFTRPVAFLLSGEMAFAYFLSHAPRGFYPVANGGDPAILFCFVFFYLFFAGAGIWSLDYAWRSPAGGLSPDRP